MRVLQVIPSVSAVHGGPSLVLALLEQGLCAQGISVTTATTDDDGPARRLEIDPPLQGRGVRRIYFRKWFDFYKVAPAMLPWLWWNVRTFDVVHIHSLFSFASVAAGLIASGRGVPYIIRPLGTLSQYGLTQRRPRLKRLSLALLENRILGHAAAVHFTSEAEWEEAKLLKLRLRAVVIPLAAQAEQRGDEQLLLRDYPALVDRQVVLYLSRLDPKKNIEGLLRAVAAVRTQRGDVMLVVAGGGQPEYTRSLKMLAQALGLEPNVVWLDHVGGARKAAAFAAAQVFVLPSLSENFGVAGVEAMLAGVPCIFGQGVAIARDAMRAGASMTVTSEPESIARALMELLADKPRQEAMGRRAREFAEREYSVQTMATRLIALYRKICKENGREVL
jgi:glycosyltransferase involved in cell wall biosynthesis